MNLSKRSRVLIFSKGASVPGVSSVVSIFGVGVGMKIIPLAKPFFQFKQFKA